MNDADLETRLRRYRPAGPPVGLRNEVLAAAAVSSPRVRLHEWTAIAASVMLAALFYWLAAIERQHLSAVVVPLPPFAQSVANATEEPQP